MASDDQQFCLKWNNFQTSIISQFETLRDDEAFTDVTIVCEGQHILAHKIILSACSPLLRDLLKSNPCSHPIIFMRDVETQHILALLEFMYTGEVNMAQTQLPAFLKTAEALKIRGLTDTSSNITSPIEEPVVAKTPTPQSPPSKQRLNKREISCSSIVTSSQDCDTFSPTNAPTTKRSKTGENSRTNDHLKLEDNNEIRVEPKSEVVEYLSDDDCIEDGTLSFNNGFTDVTELVGGMEIIPQSPYTNSRHSSDTLQGIKLKQRLSVDSCSLSTYKSDFYEEESTSDTPNVQLRNKTDQSHTKTITLGDGIEINENQLRSVKWSDYKKLTRGLATLLFSPKELATCSVTGQRWSRAGANGERPVKPALDRAKVQAIIAYVAQRFPTVEISRIKQVLAYKCKENSMAFKLKAVRYFGDQHNPPNN